MGDLLIAGELKVDLLLREPGLVDDLDFVVKPSYSFHTYNPID